MGLPQTPSPPHLYPEALQLKLYQAFIFSIPILFSIILFLLFYLFYLKRRASTPSSPAPTLPSSMNQAASFYSSCEMGLKGEIKGKLPTILYDEELRARDSQCCVCLGEYEIKEELHQVPSCKHVFHADCIYHWLRSNSTCPLCRCSVFPSTKLANPVAAIRPEQSQEDSQNSNQHGQNAPSHQGQQEQVVINLGIADFSRGQQILPTEGSSTSNTCLRDQESVVNIETSTET